MKRMLLGLSLLVTLPALAANPFADPLNSPVYTLDWVSDHAAQIQMKPGSNGKAAQVIVTKIEVGTFLWPDWHPLQKRAVRIYTQTLDGKQLPALSYIADEERAEPNTAAPNQEVYIWTLYVDGVKEKAKMNAEARFTYDQSRELRDLQISAVTPEFGFEASGFRDGAYDSSTE